MIWAVCAIHPKSCKISFKKPCDLLRNKFLVHKISRFFKEDIFHYRMQEKLRKGNAFTPVCQSFCPQMVYTPLGIPPDRHLPRQTPPKETPPSQTPPGTASAADGTHPTGMHSCPKYKYVHNSSTAEIYRT